MADVARSKRQTLQANGTLNPHPEKVVETLFQDYDFFDARDVLQVKYEMLRRVQTERWSVTQAAHAFGFSRLSFYHALEAFEREGLSGLLAKKRGPKAAHKLSAEVMAFVRELIADTPTSPTRTIAELIEQHFGFSVHPRSIERALKQQEKKHR